MYTALFLAFGALTAALPQPQAATSCVALPAGAGPTTTPDTAPAFLNNTVLSATALAATVPGAYTQVFSNLHGSTQSATYLGYSTLSSYNPATCASMCGLTNGCEAFNIYYERDPSVVPGPGCLNPASTNLIKCAFYSAPITATTVTNTGQYQDNFQVVIAGSNGYNANFAVVTQPACTSINGYKNFYYGSGYLESSAYYVTGTTTLPNSGSYPVCTAISYCLEYGALIATSKSFEIYRLGAGTNWICQFYSVTGNFPSQFSVVNNAVSEAYGYSMPVSG